MNGNISDWMIARDKFKLRDLVLDMHTEKIDDYNLLKESGLPRCDDFSISYKDFNEDNELLMDFLSKYSGFVVRAIPKTRDLPRRHQIGVSNFDECQNFLSDEIKKEDSNKYSILLTEYEPEDWSGVIISRENELVIDISKDGLPNISRGSCKVSEGVFKEHENNTYKSMKYTTKSVEERKVMWNALQYLRKDADINHMPNVEFVKGYFEFIRTIKTGKIKFIDYKTHPAYLI